MSQTQDFQYQEIVFLSHFKDLPDSRQIIKVLYPLPEVLLLTLFAVLCGADNWVEIAKFGEKRRNFLRRFAPFENGTPSHDQLGVIFAVLDAEAFQSCFVNWVSSLSGLAGDVVAIDGPLRANKSETTNWLKFTLEDAGERPNGNALTDTAFARYRI